MTTPPDNDHIKRLRKQIADAEAELDKLTERQWKLPEGHATRTSYLTNINTLNDKVTKLRTEIQQEQARIKAAKERKETSATRAIGVAFAALGALLAVATFGTGWMWAGVGVVLLGALTIAGATT